MPYPLRAFSIEELRRLAWVRLTGGQDEVRHANIDWLFDDEGLQRRVDQCVHLIRNIGNTLDLAEGYIRNGNGAEPCVDLIRPLVETILADHPNRLGASLCAEIRERFHALERASAANQLRNELDARLGYAQSVKRFKTALGHIEIARGLVATTCAAKPITAELRAECEALIERTFRDLLQPRSPAAKP